MPLTFPSHAAAILPLLHLVGTRRLPASALVIGSTAPDLVYLIGTLGADAHRPLGLLRVCLPAGLAAFVYLEALVLPVVGPALVEACPARLRPIARRVVGPRPLPATTLAWVMTAVALTLGAITHQIWDGFTHAWLWPASALYPDATVSIFGRPLSIARGLQHGSSVIGAVIVIMYLQRTTPIGIEECSVDRPGAARRLVALIALPIVGGLVAALAKLRVDDPLITRWLWNAAWSAAAWFGLLLGAVCLARRLAPRPRSDRPS